MSSDKIEGSFDPLQLDVITGHELTTDMAILLRDLDSFQRVAHNENGEVYLDRMTHTLFVDQAKDTDSPFTFPFLHQIERSYAEAEVGIDIPNVTRVAHAAELLQALGVPAATHVFKLGTNYTHVIVTPLPGMRWCVIDPLAGSRIGMITFKTVAISAERIEQAEEMLRALYAGVKEGR
jgi:hypothetical protein